MQAVLQPKPRSQSAATFRIACSAGRLNLRTINEHRPPSGTYDALPMGMLSAGKSWKLLARAARKLSVLPFRRKRASAELIAADALHGTVPSYHCLRRLHRAYSISPAAAIA